jgi:hypothetical protein
MRRAVVWYARKILYHTTIFTDQTMTVTCSKIVTANHTIMWLICKGATPLNRCISTLSFQVYDEPHFFVYLPPNKLIQVSALGELIVNVLSHAALWRTLYSMAFYESETLVN